MEQTFGPNREACAVETKAILLAENDRVRDYLKLVVGDLTDEQVKYGNTVVDDRPIGAIVQHVYGSLAFLGTVVQHGGVPDEWRPEPPPAPETRQAMLDVIDAMHARVAETWGAVGDADLTREITLPRRGTTTGAAALFGAIAHAHRHIGQIIDARCLGGFQTRALG